MAPASEPRRTPSVQTFINAGKVVAWEHGDVLVRALDFRR